MGEARQVSRETNRKKRRSTTGEDDRLNRLSLSNLATVIAALSELRQLQHVESAAWIEAVDAIIYNLRRAGNERNSALLIGVAEAIEDELINGFSGA